MKSRQALNVFGIVATLVLPSALMFGGCSSSENGGTDSSVGGAGPGKADAGSGGTGGAKADASGSDIYSPPDVVAASDGPTAPDIQPQIDTQRVSDAPLLDGKGDMGVGLEAGVIDTRSTTPSDGPIDASSTQAGSDSALDGGSEGSTDSGIDGMVETTATLLLGDTGSNSFYRFNITPATDPVLTAVVSTPAFTTCPIVGPTGELFVGQFTADGVILRYQSPLTALAPNGSISGVGVSYNEMMAFVDSELWVPNTSGYEGCTTESENLVRLAFDTTGQATAVGTVNTNLIGANRGILWEPVSRSLYVTQCAPVNTIQHFYVAQDHTVTALTAVVENGLNNPHMMVVAPWGGELFVANAGTPANPGNAILRFALDSQGNATANGSISGNGLNLPIGVQFMPWGELVVVNNGNATISRYVFDAAHTATPSRAPFAVLLPTDPGVNGVGFFTVIAGASTAVMDAGGT
jgi:hypothetical protein